MSNRDISHETGRKHARPGRVARASATARATVFLLVAFLVMANFAPARAFASVLDSVYNNPSVMWTDLQSCVVYGPSNEFDAALAIIERTYAKIQITEPMFVELSNEGTGGRFYELAQALKCAADETPSPTGDFLLYSNVSTGVTLYGAGYVWWQHGITFNDELLSGALEDFETILNGGHLGDVGGVGDGDYLQFVCNTSLVADAKLNLWDGTFWYMNGKNGLALSYNSNKLIPNTILVQIPKSVFGVQDWSTVKSAVIALARNTGNKTQQRVHIMFSNKPASTVQTQTSFTVDYGNGPYLGQTFTYDSYSSVSVSSSHSVDIDINCTYSYSSGVLTLGYDGTVPVSINQSGNASFTSGNYGTALGILDASVGGGGGTNNWPEPTEPTPDPPEPPDPIDRPVGGNPDIPEPGDPTVPETPQPGNPTTNIYVHVQEPTNTSPTDYTPWLRAILQAINNLGDKLNQESLEIQRALNTFYTNLVSSLKSISGSFLQDLTSWGRQQMQWLSDDLAYSLAMFGADLTDYLDELAQWVVDNLNFDFPNSEFDDSSIVYWLKRIWSKLGNGNINTRPTDPTEDPDGFLEWIRKAIAEFILGLGTSASDVVSDIGDLLSRLFAKFPFSVPWDILAVLGLLDAPVATPRIVIDVPITIGSWHTTYTFDVNLQPYDSAMATARSVFLILFCSWLLWLTPQVLRDLSPEDFL